MSSFLSIHSEALSTQRGVFFHPSSPLLFKRTLDVVGSGLALIVSSPLMAIVALLIKLDSSGPVFYVSPRAGKQGTKFACWKFRSMVKNANQLKETLRQRNEREDPCFKIARDPRVTKLGGLLRRYSIDELPQFWNVLKGEMSLVGPRPHPLDDFQRYEPEHMRRLDAIPGITGLWQVTARNDPSFRRNLELDLEYIQRWSLKLDLWILWRTVSAVLKGEGK